MRTMRDARLRERLTAARARARNYPARLRIRPENQKRPQVRVAGSGQIKTVTKILRHYR